MTALRKPRIVSPPEKRPARRKKRRPLGQMLYTGFVIGGASLVVLGVGLVFLPAALVLAGTGAAGLGLVGLGLHVNRSRPA